MRVKGKKAAPKKKVEGLHLPERTAWKEPPWELADAYALQALVAGKANEAQQKRALDYVIRVLAGTYDLAYRPESPRDTDFMLGRQFVGKQIVFLVNVNLGAFKGKEA